MTTTAPRLLGLSALISLIAGCPVYGPYERFDASCVDDYDCPFDTYCDHRDRVCVQFPACVSHGDCVAGSYCDFSSGLCFAPDVAFCTRDTDCQARFRCDFRDTCVPVDDVCYEDAICGADALCIEDGCHDVSETCQVDAHCGSGHVCTNHRCTALCGDGDACPSGTQCSEGLCLPTENECRDSADCPDLDTNCVEGRCLFRCEAGCLPATEQCDDSGFCRPRWQPNPNAPSESCRDGVDCGDQSRP